MISPQQLQQLWTEHSAALLLVARGHCKGATETLADDCVQEAFIRLAAQDPQPDHPKAWLLRVVRNLAIDTIRRKQRQANHEQQAALSGPQQMAQWFEAANSADNHDIDTDQLQAALQELDDETRDVVVAHLWNNMTFRQIGEAFDISHSKAHRIYDHGLARLRLLLQSKTVSPASD
ncbi:MAG: sigma-70 family RNA polymerase sigma factor [Planctomycetaceae bacterium]|nr:sigma-70 family RNA polymerase sigma factor [Planctomycetaceae bacterium]